MPMYANEGASNKHYIANSALSIILAVSRELTLDCFTVMNVKLITLRTVVVMLSTSIMVMSVLLNLLLRRYTTTYVTNMNKSRITDTSCSLVLSMKYITTELMNKIKPKAT